MLAAMPVSSQGRRLVNGIVGRLVAIGWCPS
jgi:hypothetical protein